MNRPALTPAKLAKTRALMDQHVPSAVVTGFEPLIEAVELPNKGDWHVVAAVIKVWAEDILHFKDFLAAISAPFYVRLRNGATMRA